MVILGLIDSNQHGNKWCCASDTPEEIHRCKPHSKIDNIPTNFEWYDKKSSIHELRNFECYIHPIKSSPKNVYDRTQE